MRPYTEVTTLPDLDVLCMACCCWDLLGIVGRYPELDQKCPMSEMVEAGGGQSATASAAIATLGGKAAVMGRVGSDKNGRNITEALEAVGVETGPIRVIPDTTSQFAICIIHESTGKRSIMWRNGTMGKPTPDDVDPALVARAKAVLIDSHAIDAGIYCAQVARELDKPVVLDLEKPNERNVELTSLATHPIFPLHFGQELTGETEPEAICRAILGLGPETAIITMGDQGCVAVTSDETHHVPAFKVDVVDTTGAGDVFHGAFAYGLALGKPLAENLRFASAAAALSTRGLGGRARLGTMGEVEALLTKGETLPQ